MTMKSLLLGAVAGIATIGAAHAADLPMTKAEPVEYVKVCSQFGPGFFYIPGTDSCLKISGNIRADYGFNTATSHNRSVVGGVVQSGRATNQSSFQGRAQLAFDVRTQTDYGLLRSFLLIDAATGNPGAQNWQIGNKFSGSLVYIDKAYIQFGGLTAGYAESFYAFYDNYYGDTFIAPYMGSGMVGTKQLLAYTAQFGGGLSATLSIEDPAGFRNGVGAGAFSVDTGVDSFTNAGAKMPNIIANVLYDASWGKLQVMGALHQISVLGDTDSGAGGHSKWGFAVGTGLSVNFPVLPGAYIALEANYADGANAFTGIGANEFSPAGAPVAYDADLTLDGRIKTAKSYSITGEAGFNVTPQLVAMVFGSVGKYDAPSDIAFGQDGDFTSYVIGGQLNYEIVKGFQIGAEVSYVGSTAHNGAPIFATDGGGDTTLLDREKTNSLIAGLRVKRTF
jgi:hypothetical protein